jgi:hypothetical protein
MSKSKKFINYREDEEESKNSYGTYDEFRARKRNKKIQAALRTKNIDELIHYTEEDDYY